MDDIIRRQDYIERRLDNIEHLCSNNNKRNNYEDDNRRGTKRQHRDDGNSVYMPHPEEYKLGDLEVIFKEYGDIKKSWSWYNGKFGGMIARIEFKTREGLEKCMKNAETIKRTYDLSCHETQFFY